MTALPSLTDSPQVLNRAAELFGILSAPVRLRIVSELCGGEHNVTGLLGVIGTAQSNISQHLNILYRMGVVSKRRVGAQIFYRISDDFTVLVCRAVCGQLGLQVRGPGGASSAELPGSGDGNAIKEAM